MEKCPKSQKKPIFIGFPQIPLTDFCTGYVRGILNRGFFLTKTYRGKLKRDITAVLKNGTFRLNVKTTTVNIKEIKANPTNPRVIRDAAFEKLVQSVTTAPWMLELRPLVVDSGMVVLGGNMRLKALKEAGVKNVTVIHADDLTPEQKKEFIVKDNLGYGEWDYEALREKWDVPKLEEWGLELPPLEVIDPVIVEDDETQNADEVETQIVAGDLIEIGPHRLVCGDSTRPDHVALALNGAEPYLMITDPPYGVEYDAQWRNDAMPGASTGRAVGKVENDGKADWSDTWSLSPSKVAYVYHAGVFSGVVQKSLVDNDFEIRSQIIWAKNHFALSRGDYHWKHEPCWYAVKKGAISKWRGDRKQATVWEIDKPQKSETGHSTQKPVECMARPIKNHEGDVYDPFLGSGTTMVAAHQLNRVCYGIELSPKYCQVIVNRMVKLYPNLTTLINGKPYKNRQI